VSEIRKYLETRVSVFGLAVDGFILRNGREFVLGPDSLKGARMKANECYSNCAALVASIPVLTYVEGYVVASSIPIQYAWVIDPSGNVIDPTLVDAVGGRIGGYFGVQFSTEYVERCIAKNRCYGLLDPYYNRKTIGDLIEGRADFAQKNRETA
jgi:hypothetical protein